MVHLVGDGQVPELDRSDPIEAALAFQEQGATWLHLVMADEEGAGSGLRQARDIIEAVSIDVQLMCRSGVDNEAALERALDTGCTRFNLGRSALSDLQWCAEAITRHGERIGVSLPVHLTGNGPRLAGPGRGADAGDLWQALAMLDDVGCARYVVTDVSREGSLSAPNLELFRRVCDERPLPCWPRAASPPWTTCERSWPWPHTESRAHSSAARCTPEPSASLRH